MRADEAGRRFEPDQVAEAGWDATRAGRVGAEGERHEAEGDRGGRPRARSAGDVLGVERIAHFTVGRASAHEAGGELIEIRLADEDSAGCFQL